MNNAEYPACLRELLDSEIFGEALSLALIEVAKNDREKFQFATFQDMRGNGLTTELG